LDTCHISWILDRLFWIRLA